jgi:hypothetical protein
MCLQISGAFVYEENMQRVLLFPASIPETFLSVNFFGCFRIVLAATGLGSVVVVVVIG